jgi:hypothetical protein
LAGARDRRRGKSRRNGTLVNGQPLENNIAHKDSEEDHKDDHEDCAGRPELHNPAVVGAGFKGFDLMKPLPLNSEMRSKIYGLLPDHGLKNKIAIMIMLKISNRPDRSRLKKIKKTA